MFRRWHRAILLVGLLMVPGPLRAQAPSPWSILNRLRAHVPTSTSSAISAEDLMTRVYLFADDSMRGRQINSPGNVMGVEYIAREVARMGLEPAGDSGGYFQSVPVMDRGFDSTSMLSVAGAPLVPWVDFIPRDQLRNARGIAGVPVVYGGRWGEPESLLSEDFAAGKLVILGVSRRVTGGPVGIPNRGSVMGRFLRAAGIAVVAAEMITPVMMTQYREPEQVFRSGTQPDPELPSYLYITRAAAARILGVPVDSARTGQGGTPVAGTLQFVERPIRYPARNVVAILRGRDPSLRGQYVAIGAHNDHVDFGSPPVAHDSIFALNHLFRQGGADDPTPRPTAEQAAQLNATIAEIRALTGGTSARQDSIYNGADDDASGSMGVLEIAEFFAGQRAKPRRSILFIWHVGEEAGLYGSEYFTDHPTVPRDSIVAQLNMDMIGRGGATDVTGNAREGGLLRGGPNYLQLIGSRRLSTELGSLAEAVNADGGHGFTFDYAMDANGHPQSIYCRSDHYSYARYGIPIVFFTTGGHADYHQVTDEPQYLDYDRMGRVSRFVADLATRIAGAPLRLVVDQPKPDPRGQCRQ